MVAFGFCDSNISFITMLLVTEIVHREFLIKGSFGMMPRVRRYLRARASEAVPNIPRVDNVAIMFQKDMLNQRPPFGVLS
jgi:hypothetical protein